MYKRCGEGWGVVWWVGGECICGNVCTTCNINGNAVWKTYCFWAPPTVQTIAALLPLPLPPDENALIFLTRPMRMQKRGWVAKVGAHFRNWTAFFVELCADCNSFRVCVSMCLASVHRQPVPLYSHTHIHTHTRTDREGKFENFDCMFRYKMALQKRTRTDDEACQS